MPVRKVLVVGGGAAGMLAALFAAENGAAVTLLERNEKLGKKVYITGKGRCNITNTAEREAFMQAIYRNPRFMYASFAAFDNQDMIRLMENLGVPVKVERGNRVFPESDHASDVTNALRREMERRGVRIEYNTRAAGLMLDANICRGVITESGDKIIADAVILCTGGCSYPSTGSTGDGYALAKSAGAHRAAAAARAGADRYEGKLAVHAGGAFAEKCGAAGVARRSEEKEIFLR